MAWKALRRFLRRRTETVCRFPISSGLRLSIVPGGFGCSVLADGRFVDDSAEREL
jgi:hypothetical protein